MNGGEMEKTKSIPSVHKLWCPGEEKSETDESKWSSVISSRAKKEIGSGQYGGQHRQDKKKKKKKKKTQKRIGLNWVGGGKKGSLLHHWGKVSLAKSKLGD